MKHLIYALAAFVGLSFSVQADTAESETSRIVAAANAFIATLDPGQQTNLLFAFSDNEQRARWSNLPVTMVPRAGLALKELSETQRAAAMALVASALSGHGYEKVQQIMEGDEVLKHQPNNGGPPGGPGGGGPRDGGPPNGANRGGPPGGGGSMFGKDLYYISILGTPSPKDPWMLQFGGHHLALNITIVGANGVITPTLTAAQPARYELNGRIVRPLGAENDKAFALLNALDAKQQTLAILNYRVADLVLGPGHDGETIQPEGLKASSMDDRQRAMLLDLISEWSGIVNDAYAKSRMEEIKSGLDDTYFAWSGPTTHEAGKNGTAYYRIQGPKLVIEFAPQRLGGDLTLHIHTMYRDPANDYGRALIKK